MSETSTEEQTARTWDFKEKQTQPVAKEPKHPTFEPYCALLTVSPDPRRSLRKRLFLLFAFSRAAHLSCVTFRVPLHGG